MSSCVVPLGMGVGPLPVLMAGRFCARTELLSSFHIFFEVARHLITDEAVSWRGVD